MLATFFDFPQPKSIILNILGNVSPSALKRRLIAEAMFGFQVYGHPSKSETSYKMLFFMMEKQESEFEEDVNIPAELIHSFETEEEHSSYSHSFRETLFTISRFMFEVLIEILLWISIQVNHLRTHGWYFLEYCFAWITGKIYAANKVFRRSGGRHYINCRNGQTSSWMLHFVSLRNRFSWEQRCAKIISRIVAWLLHILRMSCFN